MFKIRSYLENNIINSLIGVLLFWALGWYWIDFLHQTIFHFPYLYYYPTTGILMGILGMNMFYYYYVPLYHHKKSMYEIFYRVGYLVILHIVFCNKMGSNLELYLRGIVFTLVWSFIFYQISSFYQRRKKRKLQNK